MSWPRNTAIGKVYPYFDGEDPQVHINEIPLTGKLSAAEALYASSALYEAADEIDRWHERNRLSLKEVKELAAIIEHAPGRHNLVLDERARAIARSIIAAGWKRPAS